MVEAIGRVRIYLYINDVAWHCRSRKENSVIARSPVADLKAIKNETEVEGTFTRVLYLILLILTF